MNMLEEVNFFVSTSLISWPHIFKIPVTLRAWHVATGIVLIPVGYPTSSSFVYVPFLHSYMDSAKVSKRNPNMEECGCLETQ